MLFRLCLPLLVALCLFGCDDSPTDTSGDPGSAGLRILLTDAPSDYIASATVEISRVYLIAGADDDSSEADEDSTAAEDDSTESSNRIDLFNDPENPRTYNLMDLRDGVEALLAESPVPADEYHQLRIVVDDAEVSLVDGYTFPDGSASESLKVPSGQSSGIKVKLNDPIPAEDDKVTVVVVDFAVDDNFKLQGNPETSGIKGVIFTPVLKEKRRASEDTDGES